ncbi:MAG: IS1380 family transposase [Gemmatimonadales bacterium]
MSKHTTTQCLLFRDLLDKPVVAQFDQEHASSDGGALLLKAADRRLGLIGTLSRCLPDEREPGKVQHELADLVSQRVYGLACGYADCNDAARLAEDPIHKALLGRDPLDGAALASQPTLSRFENAGGPKDLYRFGEALADLVIRRHRKRLRGKAERITIDLDPTDDPTHGQQQLSFFHGYYDSWCYLPVLGFISFNNEVEQYLFTAVLRSGKATAKLGAVGILRRVIDRLREAFPRTRLMVRLDGGFACPEVLEFLDDQPRLDYVVAIAKNKVLERRAKRLMGRARRLSRGSKKTERVFGECQYAAGKWSYKRRVVIKAEVTRLEGREPKNNPRFVVTNLRSTPHTVYQRYRARGEVENRIKELQYGLQIDRTSCTRFWANQFRVLLTATAYVLMQELRLHAKHTGCARAQVSTLRERLLKVGVWIEVSVRRIVLHLPRSYPFKHDWGRLAVALGARAG